uniref:Protein TIC 214 n=1 Tax=Lecanorchis kiusiana TaxID=915453 RepID=A0A6G7KVI9_9ASPA|nr:Ycf1 protein [Lecanorchis kiusiana]QII89401.1 Ycf1 protein [Lecanorchis kiusiana]
MILKSLILSLWIKIINSVVALGLYYGFLTTLSIGPSYIFILRARIMEEGTEREVSATTGFIVGQLVMFISIYYMPLHLALDRPHTITFLGLPYLLFNFFCNNQQIDYDYYGSTIRNSMRDIDIQCVFLNNLIFPLFNHFILPSSTLARLVNIYMFRCNNKIAFLISSFIGWLIGYILFMRWVELVLFWIQQNNSLKYKMNRYRLLELRDYMSRIFSILLFITCVYYLGRAPLPIFAKKLKEKETSETKEGVERNEGSGVEKTFENKKKEQNTEEKPYRFLEEKEYLGKLYETGDTRANGKKKKNTKDEFHFQEARYQDSPVYDYEDSNMYSYQDGWEWGILKKEKDNFWFEKTFVNFFFDYRRWYRPLRYINNDQFENALRNEMSQFCFYTCLSDGKQIISFTYPTSLSIFSEMLERKIISLYIKNKLYEEDTYNYWIYLNEIKKCNLNKELRSRIKVVEKTEGYPTPSLDILDKRVRLCDDDSKNKCLPKAYDPLLNGIYRGTIKKLDSRTILNRLITYTDKDTEYFAETFWINKIHDLIIKDSLEIYRQSYLNYTYTHTQFVFDVITTHTKDQRTMKNKSIGIQEIHKKVSRWSYKLTDELEEAEENENEEESTGEDADIYSRRASHVIIYNDTDQKKNLISRSQNTNLNDDTVEMEEATLINYSQQPDFRRNLIKGSMRSQRRKTVIWGIFQVNVHSPLFLDRIDKIYFFDINKMNNLIFRNWMERERESELKISYFENKKTVEETEKDKKYKNQTDARLEVAEAWEAAQAQHIRGLLLLTQSFIRKYILFPSFIIAKNILRILLLQSPEWYEDWKEWKKERYIKCTRDGIPLSETEFPQDWLTEGIQIKIIYPFCLKPWRKSRALRSHHKDPMKKRDKKKKQFVFLTVWGMEAELPFGTPRKRPSFFNPIYKELIKRSRKVKKNFLRVLNFLKEKLLKGKIKDFIFIKKEQVKGVVIIVIKLISKGLEKVNPMLLLELSKQKVHESNENEKNVNVKIHNKIISESSALILPMIDDSLIEKRTKDLYDKIIQIRIRNKIKINKTDKKKKEIVLISLIFNNKRSKSYKHILKIFQSTKNRLMRKSNYFIQSFIRKIYIYILLCTISKINANVQNLFEAKDKIVNFNFKTFFKTFNKKINKLYKNIKKFYKSICIYKRIVYIYKNGQEQAYIYTYNNERDQGQEVADEYEEVIDEINPKRVYKEVIDETNKNKINLLFTIKKLFSNTENLDNGKINSNTYWNLSSLTQAYVFYKLSQTQLLKINKYHFRLILQYQGSYPFFNFEDKLKDSFMIHRIFDLKSRYTKRNKNKYVMSEWKNWLKSHYQYDLSKKKWSQLIPKKWRNRIRRHRRIQHKELIQSDLYKSTKDQLFHVRIDPAINSFMDQKYKNKSKKHYRYDKLSYKYISYSNLNISKSVLEIRNRDSQIPYYSNKLKNFNFDVFLFLSIPSNDYKKKGYHMNGNTNFDRKYFDYRILNFDFINHIDIEIWTSTHIGINQTTNAEINRMKNLIKMENKSIIYPSIHKEIKSRNKKSLFFDYMGMKSIYYNNTIFNLEPWFLPESVLLFNLYRIKPWIISARLLFFNFLNINIKIKEKIKNINVNPNIPNINPSYKKKGLELGNSKHEKHESQGNLVSNKDKIKKKKVMELYSLLDKYLIFQLRGSHLLNQRIMKNIESYCLLLGLMNPREVAISSVRRGELNLDEMIIQKYLFIEELIRKGIWILEPIRLYIRRDGKSIIHQTMHISLVDKLNQQTNIKYKNKKISEDLLVPENLLSSRRRREFRIRMCLNSRNCNVFDININQRFCNENKIRHFGPYSKGDNHLSRYTTNLRKLNLFLWPNYQLEDLACMNRYWFDTNNGSRFSMLRIYMYPQTN